MKRSRGRIAMGILDLLAERDRRKTELVYQANLNFRTIDHYPEKLVESGLVAWNSRTRTWHVTLAGKEAARSSEGRGGSHMKAFIYVVGLLAGAAGLYMLVFCLSILAGAVELHITGSITGSGNQSLFFAGDNISAFWNGSLLNVTAVSA